MISSFDALFSFSFMGEGGGIVYSWISFLFKTFQTITKFMQDHQHWLQILACKFFEAVVCIILKYVLINQTIMTIKFLAKFWPT